MEPKEIKKAINRARYAYDKGTRAYDEKHNTFNPAPEYLNILQHVNDLLECHGIESFKDDIGTEYSYCNTGDTYCCTLVYNHSTERFSYSQSIGDIIEHSQR